jgi:hypothetical protein
MWVRAMMKPGLVVSARASSRARPICAWSWPSMRQTRKPYASYRRPTSSLKASAVLPSMVIRLSS